MEQLVYKLGEHRMSVSSEKDDWEKIESNISGNNFGKFKKFKINAKKFK